MSSSSRTNISLSLRTLFPEAIFTSLEDHPVGSCSLVPRRPSRHDIGHVFVAGYDALDMDDDTAEEAIRLGASIILTERLLPVSAPQVIVPNVRQAYAKLLHCFAGQPSEKLLTVGILGTHGKTSVALMIASMMKRIGGKVSYRTSLGTTYDSPSSKTRKSEVAELTKWLARSVKEDCAVAIVELTEEMLLDRIASATAFDVLVIPSLRKPQNVSKKAASQIDNAIERMTRQLKDHGLVIYNADDARLNRWVERKQIPAIGYALDADANVRGKRISRTAGEQTMMVSAGRSLMPLTTALCGDHNLRNLLAATTVGHAFGLDLFEVIGGVEALTSVPGRMQSISCGQDFSVYVDTADQADRLAVGLHSLASIGGPITCVAEVPAAADAEQRAAFGRVLSKAASRVILTQTRHTQKMGQKLMWEVIDGCDNPAAVHLVPDRMAAIELALRSAQPGEQVLLAGWGADRWTNARSSEPQSDSDLAKKLLYELAESHSTTTEISVAQPSRPAVQIRAANEKYLAPSHLKFYTPES